MPKTLKPTALLSALLLSACATQATKDVAPQLLKTQWLLEDLGGKGVVDRAQATLAFPAENKVAGNASCNRFFGAVEIKGEAIKFGGLGSTRMACLNEAISKQEANYLKALENAETIRLEGPYLLIQSKGLDRPLRFTQMTAEAGLND